MWTRSAAAWDSANDRVYVVLGGSGYIGSAVVRALLRRGDSVVVVDRIRRNDLPLYPLDQADTPGAAAYAQVDLLDRAALAAVLRGIAMRWRALVVIHLVGLFVKDPSKRAAICADDYVQHNVVTTDHIVDVLNELHAEIRFIYQSAGGAYRTFLDGVKRPLEPYIETKIVAEHVIAERLRTPWVILRVVRVLGLGRTWRPLARRPTPQLLSALLEARAQVQVPYDIITDMLAAGRTDHGCAITLDPANAQIAYVHLQDNVSALLQAASPDVPTGHIFNVTTWPALTFFELGEIFRRELEALGVHVTVTCRESPSAIMLAPSPSPHFSWQPILQSSREVVTVALWQYLTYASDLARMQPVA